MNLDNKQKKIWEASENTEFIYVPNKNEVWERLIQQIQILENEANLKNKNQFNNSLKWKLWPHINIDLNKVIAYGLIFILLLPISYNYYTTNVVLTKIGQQDNIVLSDGSKIILNAESKLVYNRNFNKDNRSVKLEGEAYFQVSQNDLPFTINTDYGKITVLGTAFNVRNRNDGFELGVNEGKVKISNKDNVLQLIKGQSINVESKFNTQDISDITYNNYPDWINNKFYCNNTPLKKLCDEIERTFDIKIRFSKYSLKEIAVTGVIDAPNINTVLHTISLLTQHEFKLVGDICTII